MWTATVQRFLCASLSAVCLLLPTVAFYTHTICNKFDSDPNRSLILFSLPCITLPCPVLKLPIIICMCVCSQALKGD